MALVDCHCPIATLHRAASPFRGFPFQPMGHRSVCADQTPAEPRMREYLTPGEVEALLRRTGTGIGAFGELKPFTGKTQPEGPVSGRQRRAGKPSATFGLHTQVVPLARRWCR
jgi:hypothetical protein